MAEIELKKVSKRFNPGLFKKKVQAVSDLSLTVEPGEVFGLIGPNGAGKSTTIRMMLGLIRADSGSILFRGKELQEAGIQKEIGYLPENPYLYEYLTLRELLVFSGRASGLAKAETAARSRLLMEKVDLAFAANRRLRTFSKGMLQRAGICFALLHDPSLVILDEPMSGLDPVGRKMVFDIVMELKEQGKTIFFCSHILSDVERLCDRIGLLVEGRLARLFHKNEFRENERFPIHLVLEPPTGSQKDRLAAEVGEVVEGRGECILSVSPDRLLSSIEFLGEQGIKVLGTRSDRVSLERLFVDTVEGQHR